MSNTDKIVKFIKDSDTNLRDLVDNDDEDRNADVIEAIAELIEIGPFLKRCIE